MSANGVTSMTDLFPDQVVSEILTRLPAKTVCRFKTVSKRWASIIGNRAFIAAYLKQNGVSWVKLDKVIRTSGTKSETGSDPIIFSPVKHSNVYTLTINPHRLLKPNEPLTDPHRKQVPVTGFPQGGIQPNAEIIHVSNGFVLFAVSIDPEPLFGGMDEYERRPMRIRMEIVSPDDPKRIANPDVRYCLIYSMDPLEDVLFITNPVTREWARVPRPPLYLDARPCFGFIADPTTGEFVIGYYVYNLLSEGKETPILTCMSSLTGKWVKKTDTGGLLKLLMGKRSWRPSCRFEFDGKMFWCDVSFGIVCWDEDPFVGAASEEVDSVSTLFVTLPSGRVTVDLTREIMDTRCVDTAMGCIQYMELLGDEGGLEVWRLKDYKADIVEWECVYKVGRDVLQDFGVYGFKVSFVDPTDPDVAVLESIDCVLSLDVKNQAVESYNSFIGHVTSLPLVLPSYPASLPPPLYADYAKEQGNGCFKGQNFKEALAWYSRSISLSPSAVAYGNRAMVYLKVGKYHEAEEDCTKCLDLDDRYFKGYARRATARKELGDLNGALEDVKFALTLEPESKEMKQQCDELKSLLGMESSSDGENDDGDTTSDDGKCVADDGDAACKIGIDGDPSLERMYI